jgi:hypothetical protein
MNELLKVTLSVVLWGALVAWTTYIVLLVASCMGVTS